MERQEHHRSQPPRHSAALGKLGVVVKRLARDLYVKAAALKLIAQKSGKNKILRSLVKTFACCVRISGTSVTGVKNYKSL